MTRCMGCMGEYDGNTQVCPHCGYAQGTAAREAYHLLPESILDGRYIVGRVLGFGGFGVTYIGWDAQLERIVAIKEFLPTTFATRLPGGSAVTVYQGGATEQFGFGLHRFVEEAQRLAQFNGIWGITDIYDTFSGNNTAYIVMEYLKGHDVKVALAKEGPLPYAKAWDIVLRVCDTLAQVHQKGIIHRDISPDNIFLTDAGEVKLLDFGAARYESSVNSKSLSVILKSGYAPEEQYRSKGEQGPWTDVYALAATFYKMLTGTTPPDSMERAVRDEIKEPSKCGAQLPKSAENAIMNALNIRKADRTQSVEAFKAALQTGEVERVKAKPGRTRSGGVPVPAMVGMALAGLLLVAFIALGATGVVNIGGGAAQLDNFGDAVQAGKIVVPNLVGMDENEAKLTLEEMGLTMEIGKAHISESIAIGAIANQEPQPGRQVAKGDTVSVQVCAGSMTQAMDSGAIPSFVGMTAVESTGFVDALSDYGLEYCYATYAYEYSDDVPAGNIVRFSKDGNANECWLYVSAGPDNVTSEWGELRAPFFVSRGSSTYIYAAFALPAIAGEENERSVNAPILEYSTDGAQWEDLLVSSHVNNTFNERLQPVGRVVPYIGRSIDDELLKFLDDMAGKRLQFRIAPSRYEQEMRNSLRREELYIMLELSQSEAEREELYAMLENLEAGKEETSVVMLEQTVTIEVDGEAPQLDSCEKLTTEQILDLVGSGDYTEDDLPYRVRDAIENDTVEELTLYRLQGDFNVREDFSFTVGESNRCYKVGEVLLSLYNDVEEGTAMSIYSEFETTVSPDGLEITMTTRPYTTFTL